jgi:hypothetical protein
MELICDCKSEVFWGLVAKMKDRTKMGCKAKLGMILGLVAPSSFLSTTLCAKELRWTHYGTRPLAMGNAYVGVADDFNSLFYNPAGLARLPSWSMEIMNPSFGVGANTLSTINDVTSLANSNAASSGGQTAVQQVLSTFDSLSGKPQYVNIGLTPHLVFPGFGFGLGIDVGGTLVAHRDPSASVEAGANIIVPFTYAKSMLEDRLSLGASLKGVFKTGVDRDFSLADISAFTKNDTTNSESKSDNFKDYLNSGRGFGVDVGLLFTPVKTMEPTMGLSITDVGGTPLTATSDLYGKPKPRDPAVNTGISVKPVKSGNMYVMTSVDAHAINQPMHFSKKLNLGSELGLGKVLKFQLGLHQGELSGGFQLDAWLLILRFATYAEQLGPTAGEDKRFVDRRYVAEMKLLL